MREALHVNDQQLYIIPQDLTETEVENHRQIAKKGTFICPYCEAKLHVRSGPILGNYFSHQHGEGCEPSKQSEARSRRYEQLKKNDTPRQSQILALMYDELHVLSKVYTHINCTRGYLDTNFTKYVPDISLKIYERKYAITIVTNVTSLLDVTKAKNIRKHYDYYIQLGYEPLFFIERSNLAIDTDGHSLVLWQTEKEALTTQAADLHWQKFLTQLAPANQLQQLLKIPTTSLNVKSILYITPANESIAIEAFHLIEQPNTAPTKAYFFNQPYVLTFALAFKLTNDSLTLANMELELANQTKYAEKFKESLAAYLQEQQEKELKLQQKPMEEKAARDNQKQIAEQKNKAYQDKFKDSTYKKAEKERRMQILKQAYYANN
ncbi:competence protein CoiA family protein [Sporosarcina sp. HYO08]|uniref:competence protein CoiA family protein n=1 Tax=Sporosarcina sp. HYO08 TaxID=1759557 RepID=UPI0007986DEB|nr:competence protein CoiA family protein [Sporosarcina sp. HYO08]KXH81856.1 hypothetical protein AU377_06220 [Sporosarcina sp. HYO08]